MQIFDYPPLIYSQSVCGVRYVAVLCVLSDGYRVKAVFVQSGRASLCSYGRKLRMPLQRAGFEPVEKDAHLGAGVFGKTNVPVVQGERFELSYS